MAFRQIVEYGYFVAFIEQLFDTDAADVTCSPSDKNGLHWGETASWIAPDNQ
jgi:hypothetical protein